MIQKMQLTEIFRHVNQTLKITLSVQIWLQYLYSKYSQISSNLFFKLKIMKPKKVDKNANMIHHH